MTNKTKWYALGFKPVWSSTGKILTADGSWFSDDSQKYIHDLVAKKQIFGFSFYVLVTPGRPANTRQYLIEWKEERT